ncbi:MAG: SRPBCC domain-containing protein [Chthoniobacteraceae bacterium]
MSTHPTESTPCELTVTRVFDAPRPLLWKVWTDPQAITGWFCTEKVTAISVKADVRVGGRYRIQTRHTSGEYFTTAGVYTEVKEPERLVFTWAFEKDGSEPDFGELEAPETRVTLEFRDLGAQTELVLTHDRFVSTQSRDNHEEGWTRILGALAEYLTAYQS